MFGLSSLQFHKLRGEPIQDGDAILSFCVWIDGEPVEGTVIAEEMTVHEPNKEDDNEDLLRRRWRIRVADSTFDKLVFGKDSDDDEGRARLSDIVAMKVEEVGGICRLTEAQKEKLTLAGRGDIQRLQDRIATLRNRVRQNVDIDAKPVELLKQSHALLYDLLSESQSVRLTIAFPLGRGVAALSGSPGLDSAAGRQQVAARMEMNSPRQFMARRKFMRKYALGKG